MPRVTDQFERLARDICWVEFSNPSVVGLTKAQYWEKLSSDKKAEYCGEALRVCWLVEELGASRFIGMLSKRKKD